MSGLEVYIFHGNDDVILSCFYNDKFLCHSPVAKRRLGEELVEKFEELLAEAGFSLKSVNKIYLSNSFSTWNASRLVTLFVKSLSYFGEVLLLLKQESLDKKDVGLELKKFPLEKKSFRIIENPEEVRPLYKKCPNTNI